MKICPKSLRATRFRPTWWLATVKLIWTKSKSPVKRKIGPSNRGMGTRDEATRSVDGTGGALETQMSAAVRKQTSAGNIRVTQHRGKLFASVGRAHGITVKLVHQPFIMA